MCEQEFTIDALLYAMSFLPQEDQLDHFDDDDYVEEEAEKVYGCKE